MSEMNDIPVEPGIPRQTQAVSLYQTDAMDDFPVLKAFQQYVDAEQAKAHKRLMSICIFFTIMLTLVVGIFVFLLFWTMTNNQPSREAVARSEKDPLADANLAFQKQILEQSQKMNEQLMNQLMNRQAQAPVAAPQPTVLDSEVQRQNLELQKKLMMLELEKKFGATDGATPLSPEQHAKDKELTQKEAKLEAREAKLKAEADRLKAKEIDLRQRQLYPDAFSPEAKLKADQEVKAAREEVERIRNEAKEAERKAMLAERRAREAQEKAEEAEFQAILEKSKLEQKMQKLSAEKPVVDTRDEVDMLLDDLPPLSDSPSSTAVKPAATSARKPKANPAVKKPAPKPIPAPVVEAVQEPIAEPLPAPITEPAQVQVTEPAPEKLPEPLPEPTPAPEPVAEAKAKPEEEAVQPVIQESGKVNFYNNSGYSIWLE